MALNFPTNPATNDSYTEAGKTWYYTGSSWQLNTVVTSPYTKWAVQDENSARYTAHNGYDGITNRNPDLDNVPFNQWVLNNSTNLPLVIKNGVLEQTGSYNTADIDVTNLALINNVAVNPIFIVPPIDRLVTNNGFVYFADETNGVSKHHQSNLSFVGNTSVSATTVVVNNGFIYSSSSNIISKFNEATLDFVSNVDVGSGFEISTIKANNGYVYVGSRFVSSYQPIKKYYESNLAFVGNSSIDGSVLTMYINNGYLFAAGGDIIQSGGVPDNKSIRKYHESNLTLVETTPFSNSFDRYTSLTGNDGFLYATHRYVNNTFGLSIKKYYQSNLGFIGNSPSLSNIEALGQVVVNNGYVYTGGRGFSLGGDTYDVTPIYKYDETTLQEVAQTPVLSYHIPHIAIDNNSIFSAQQGNATSNSGAKLYKYQEFGFENTATVNLYSITNIKGGL
jgi:hypothetical protein